MAGRDRRIAPPARTVSNTMNAMKATLWGLGAGLSFCIAVVAFLLVWTGLPASPPQTSPPQTQPPQAPPPQKPIFELDTFKPVLTDISIDAGHRWYIVYKDEHEQQLKLIDDAELIRASIGRIIYRTNGVAEFFDNIGGGPHEQYDFNGFKLYRDGQRRKTMTVMSPDRFNFGPLAGKGIPVLACVVRGSSEQVRTVVAKDTATWLYPDNDPRYSSDISTEFYFFIQPADWQRVKDWPGIDCPKARK